VTHPVRVPLGVREAEHRPPRDAEDGPAVDAQVRSQPFHVGDVVRRVDARPVHAFFAGVRSASARRALVEQDGPVPLRVEVAPRIRGAPGPGTTVHVHHRQPVGRANLLVVQNMAIADRQMPDVERLRRLPQRHSAEYA